MDKKKAENHQVLKSKGHSLQASAMCSDADGLLIVDSASHSVWKAPLSLDSKCITPKLMFNLPPNCKATSIASKNSAIFVVTDLGLHRFDSECKLIIPSAHLLGVSCNSAEVAVTDERGVVYRVEGCDLQVLSGTLQTSDILISSDGFSKNAKHAQPGAICHEENTIYVCDQASLHVRVITSVKPLLKYYDIIQDLYKAFSVHANDKGFKDPQPMNSVSSLISNVCQFLNKMVDDIRSAHNNPGLKPNGPQGAVPHVTVVMFTQLQENMKALETVLLRHEHLDIHPGSLLSTPCEHHFSVMRSRYPMPTFLQYCQHLQSVVREHVKRCTITSYKYFTAKKSYYPQPELQQLESISTVSKRSSTANKAKLLSVTDMRLMLNWRQDFCAGMVKIIHGVLCQG